MRTILSAAFAMVFLVSSQAFGETDKPIQLSSEQMDRVTAGIGANNVATTPWPALLNVGFSLNHNSNADPGTTDQPRNGILGVAVPSAVPNSICISFCGP